MEDQPMVDVGVGTPQLEVRVTRISTRWVRFTRIAQSGVGETGLGPKYQGGRTTLRADGAAINGGGESLTA